MNLIFFENTHKHNYRPPPPHTHIHRLLGKLWIEWGLNNTNTLLQTHKHTHTQNAQKHRIVTSKVANYFYSGIIIQYNRRIIHRANLPLFCYNAATNCLVEPLSLFPFFSLLTLLASYQEERWQKSNLRKLHIFVAGQSFPKTSLRTS